MHLTTALRAPAARRPVLQATTAGRVAPSRIARARIVLAPCGKQGAGTPMDKEAAARIQSAEAKAHDGKVEKGSFAARSQSAAARNEAAEDDTAITADNMKDEGTARTASDQSKSATAHKQAPKRDC